MARPGAPGPIPPGPLAASRPPAVLRPTGPVRVETPRTLALRRFRRDLVGMIGVALVVVLALIALFAPVLAPHDPLMIDLAAVLRPPGPGHWMGTDESGRDV